MYRELNEITELELTDKCFNNYMNNPYRVLGVLCNVDKEKVSTLVKRVNELKQQDNLSEYIYDVDSKLIKRDKINVNKLNESMKDFDIYQNKIYTFSEKKYVQKLLTAEVYKEFFETRKMQSFDCFIANYFYMLVVDRGFESLYEWDPIFEYINKVLMLNIEKNVSNKNKFSTLVENRFSNVEKADSEYLVKFKKALDENLVTPILDAINEIDNIKILGNILRYISKYEHQVFRNIESYIYYKVLDLIKIDNDEISRNITVKKASLNEIIEMSKNFIKDYYEIVYNLPCGDNDNIVYQQIRDKYYVQIRSFVNLLLFNGKYLETEYVVKDIIKCSGKVYKEEAKVLYENVSEIIKGYKKISSKIKQIKKDEKADLKELITKDEAGCIETSVPEIKTTYYKAIAGNIEAEYTLGIMISEGKLDAYLNKAEEVKFGLKWIEKAANHKNIKAMKYLYMYNVNQANKCDKKTYKGKKVFKTKVARADKWLQKLIEQNDEDAKAIASSEEYKSLIKDINKQEGCYIATAVYGSYEDEHVRVLRNFRDRCLLESGLGTKFVELYYKYSPYYADKLQNKKVINKIVKGILNIFVKTLNKKYKD